MAQPKTLPLICVEEGAVAAAGLGKPQTQWAAANGFTGQRGRLLALPSRAAGSTAIFRHRRAAEPADAGHRPRRRRAGAGPLQLARRLRRSDSSGARLPARRLSLRSLPQGQGGAGAGAARGRRRAPRSSGWSTAPSSPATSINTPPNDLGPDAFEKEIRAFAARHKMKLKAIVGDDLLKQNFPMIHAVGRAGPRRRGCSI